MSIFMSNQDSNNIGGTLCRSRFVVPELVCGESSTGSPYFLIGIQVLPRICYPVETFNTEINGHSHIQNCNCFTLWYVFYS